MLSKLLDILDRERILFEQGRELAKLRAEIEALRLQNAKIHRAMRRCLTCEYRLDALAED